MIHLIYIYVLIVTCISTKSIHFMHSNFCITPFRQTLLVSDIISVCFHYVRRVNQYCLILKNSLLLGMTELHY